MSSSLRCTEKSHEVDVLFCELGGWNIDQIAIANEIRKVVQPKWNSGRTAKSAVLDINYLFCGMLTLRSD